MNKDNKPDIYRLLVNWFLLLSSPFWVIPFLVFLALDNDFREVFIEGSKSIFDI